VHHGRVVKRTGDGILIEFRSVVDAVRCALEVQNGLAERNEGLPPERRIEFRIGVHLGDVVEEADCDLMGDGVALEVALLDRRAFRPRTRESWLGSEQHDQLIAGLWPRIGSYGLLAFRRFVIVFKRFTQRLDGLYVTIAMMMLLLSPAG
jgi:hypothetical protein